MKEPPTAFEVELIEALRESTKTIVCLTVFALFVPLLSFLWGYYVGLGRGIERQNKAAIAAAERKE